MLSGQDGRCAICGVSVLPPKKAVVDHCHATGRVRGILCPNCNLGLGHFYDTPALLWRALSYLNET